MLNMSIIRTNSNNFATAAIKKQANTNIIMDAMVMIMDIVSLLYPIGMT